MRWKNEMKEMLEKMDQRLAQIERNGATVGILSEEIDRLRKQNERLMDRFMSTDFEKYKTYNPDYVPDYSPQVVFEGLEDNAGEILETE